MSDLWLFIYTLTEVNWSSSWQGTLEDVTMSHWKPVLQSDVITDFMKQETHASASNP